jgi:hypothetical protein
MSTGRRAWTTKVPSGCGPDYPCDLSDVCQQVGGLLVEVLASIPDPDQLGDQSSLGVGVTRGELHPEGVPPDLLV